MSQLAVARTVMKVATRQRKVMTVERRKWYQKSHEPLRSTHRRGITPRTMLRCTFLAPGSEIEVNRPDTCSWLVN